MSQAGCIRCNGAALFASLLVLFAASAGAARLNIQYVDQDPDFCGEACLEMVTDYFWRRSCQHRVHNMSDIPPDEKNTRGIMEPELLKMPDKLGLIVDTDNMKMYFDFSNYEEVYAKNEEYLINALRCRHPVLVGIWW